MKTKMLGEGVPTAIEHAARAAVREDERARGIVTDGTRFEMRTTPRLFAGERMIALVFPVIDVDETAPIIDIEED